MSFIMTSQRPVRVGPYEIRETIGRGGMAAVYTAYQSSLDRIVAIKVISQHLAAEPEFMSRFRQEALAIARLTHPNIITVHDFGEDGGIPYLVMEYVEGVTLGDLIEEGLALERVADILAQVGAGLDYAHSRGIVHRDIKPQNVLVTLEGRAVLADFGLARMMEGAQNLTMSGGVVGTPEYMSPEQASGRPTDQRTDVYALGVILYEMVAGERPFTAETPLGVLMKHIQDQARPMTQIRPGLPSGLDAVAARALAKNPDQRFQTAGDLVRAYREATGQALPASSATVGPAGSSSPTAAPARPSGPEIDLSRYEGLRATAVKADQPHLTPSLVQLRANQAPGRPPGAHPPAPAPGQEDASPATRVCPSCAATIPAGAGVCPNCMHLLPFDQVSARGGRRRMERKQVRVPLLSYNLRWDPDGLQRARKVVHETVEQLAREGWELSSSLEGSGTFQPGRTAAGQVVASALLSVQRVIAQA